MHDQLLYLIHLFAVNPALPLTSKYFYLVLKRAPPSVMARYLFNRHCDTSLDLAGLISKALTYPACTLQVFQRYLDIVPASYRHLYPNQRQTNDAAAPIKETPTRLFMLPRRFFRDLEPTTLDGTQQDNARHAFLEFLYALPPVSYVGTDKTQALKPNTNSHDGYPLIKAVQARDMRLINFLLSHKADPNKKDKSAVLLAIHQRNLDLVKLLVEGNNQRKEGHVRKKKKKEDIVDVDNILLAAAVRANATDIVEWLVTEKGCVPDIKILRSMQ
jgi:hypothetical protein